MPHYEFFCHECKKLFDKILASLKAGFRPYAETEELAETERLRLIAVYEAAIAREAAGQA